MVDARGDISGGGGGTLKGPVTTEANLHREGKANQPQSASVSSECVFIYLCMYDVCDVSPSCGIDSTRGQQNPAAGAASGNRARI